jgi:hypothetical protein
MRPYAGRTNETSGQIEIGQIVSYNSSAGDMHVNKTRLTLVEANNNSLLSDRLVGRLVGVNFAIAASGRVVALFSFEVTMVWLGFVMFNLRRH